MVDIHHHLLPGLDDGSPDIQTSLAMARMAEEDGISHIVCTPHANSRFAYDPFRVNDLITDLRARMNAEGISVELARGADFHMTYDNIQTAIADPARFSIAGRGYLMTELPDYGSLGTFDESYYELHRAGMMPVVTHPERNPTLQAQPAKLLDWLRLGILVQVTANSVTGEMGRKAQRMALDLLEKKWVHFVATDAHNLTSRPPKLHAAYDVVADRFGAAYADSLCRINPLCAFEGRPLPPQPMPVGLEDEYLDRPRESWWQRLFRSFR